MREADSQVFIVSGGLAPAGTDDYHIAPVESLASMCALGANHMVDAIGFHPYGYPVAPQDTHTWNAWQRMNNTTPSIRSTLAAYGTPNLPIWATEYGAPTNGPGGLATSAGYVEGGQPYHVDEAFQAELATDSVRAALDTPGVSALFWYSYRDLGTDTSTNENFFGLRRFDGTMKPAFSAMQSAIKQYGGDSPTP
jgi:polysaccharide biosynthesis protein PslG